MGLVSGTREGGLGPYLSCSRRSRGEDEGRYRDQSKSGLYDGWFCASSSVSRTYFGAEGPKRGTLVTVGVGGMTGMGEASGAKRKGAVLP